jgi:hypothetical protein
MSIKVIPFSSESVRFRYVLITNTFFRAWSLGVRARWSEHAHIVSGVNETTRFRQEVVIPATFLPRR